MSFFKRFTTILLPLMVTAVIFYCGTLPENPMDPSNTSISAVIKTAEGKILKNSLADTVNKKFLVGAALRLPENIDSIRLSISFKNDTIFDTMFTLSGKVMSHTDTLWIEQTFFSPGIYYATFKPYTSVSTNISPATIDIMMVEADVMPENHKPSISVSGNTILKPGDTCVLSVTKSDPDTKQLLTTSTKGKPEGSSLKDTKFTWIIPPTFSGRDTILFIVSDNGYPQESDTETVVITVTSTPHAPLITISGDSIIKPLETCSLTVHTSDSDPGQKLVVTMAGQPAGAVLLNDSQFTWTAPNVTSAKHTITFTVTDNGIPPLSASASITILVSADSAIQNPTFTVTYIGNGNTSGTVPVDTNRYISGASVTVATAGTLVKTGSTFTGWNTNAAGTGIARAAGTLYPISAANDTLYAQWTTNPTYTVTYIGNGNTSGTVPVDLNKYISGASVTVAAAGTLVKTGSTFTGWNTNTAGTGTARAAGSAYAIGAVNDTLYAQWTTNPTYSVTYIGNGSTSGSVPVDSNKYMSGASVTVAAAGTLVKTGSTFTGWNTNTAGTGTAHAAGSSYAIGAANDTLYAQWTTNPTFTVTYDANTGSGTAPADANKYEAEALVTVLGSATLVKTGYTFNGWNTVADGSGTAHAAATTFKMPSANVTLYAQWKIKQYSVTYDANGATAGSVPADANRHDSASSVTTMANTGSLVKTGYIFDGWNTTADGKGTTYTAGTGTFTISANITLFAKWKIKTYTLRYDGNGNMGGDVPDDAAYDSNTTVTVAGNINGLVKGGFDFNGWNTKANGSGVALAAASTFKIKSDTTLFAQWIVKKYTLTIETPVNGTVNLSGTVSVDSAVATTITATPSSGYKFRCWRVVSGSAQIADTTSASTTVTLTKGNATIKAVFACLTFVKKLAMAQYNELSIRDVVQADDGSYMLAGMINSISGIDIKGIAIRLNLNGDTVWTRTFPARDIQSIQKESSGFIITGTGNSDDDFITVFCYGLNGNQLWSYSNFNIGQSYSGKTTRMTSDNGYITSGTTNQNLYLYKTDAGKREAWSFEYDGGGVDGWGDCVQTSDGGYMMAGGANMGVNTCVIKVNSDGKQAWRNYFESPLQSTMSCANSIENTSDGSCVIGGSVYDGTSTSGYLLKVSQAGAVNLLKKYSNSDNIVSIQPLSDGYFIAGRTTIIASGGSDFYLARVNSSGTIVKETAYGTDGADEYCTGMNLTKDGGCIMVGADNWVIKTDENGEVK